MRKTINLGDVPLANRCHFCGGDGLVDVEWNKDGDPIKALPCGECDGKGGHLTDEGQAILDLINAYGDK